MSLTRIPTLTDGTTAYRQRVRLDGEDWIFDLLWNGRTESWSLAILSVDGAEVLRGQGVVCNLPLLQRAIEGPPGQLWAASSDGGVEGPGLTELGGRVSLWYASADETALLV